MPHLAPPPPPARGVVVVWGKIWVVAVVVGGACRCWRWCAWHSACACARVRVCAPRDAPAFGVCGGKSPWPRAAVRHASDWIVTASSTIACVHPLPSPACTGGNPCPSAYPFLEEHESTGYYFCYRGKGCGQTACQPMCSQTACQPRCSYTKGLVAAPAGGQWGHDQRSCPGEVSAAVAPCRAWGLRVDSAGAMLCALYPSACLSLSLCLCLSRSRSRSRSRALSPHTHPLSFSLFLSLSLSVSLRACLSVSLSGMAPASGWFGRDGAARLRLAPPANGSSPAATL